MARLLAGAATSDLASAAVDSTTATATGIASTGGGIADGCGAGAVRVTTGGSTSVVAAEGPKTLAV
ncbi:hypothetical protein [Actinoplanes sp. NPDC026623]|uniref:hypothetical protein n=1 Tax=Actinoplanes sp. NPDC026623 TaxID=3155610 RepID=UPI0033C55A53